MSSRQSEIRRLLSEAAEGGVAWAKEKLKQFQPEIVKGEFCYNFVWIQTILKPYLLQKPHTRNGPRSFQLAAEWTSIAASRTSGDWWDWILNWVKVKIRIEKIFFFSIFFYHSQTLSTSHLIISAFGIFWIELTLLRASKSLSFMSSVSWCPFEEYPK